MSIVIKPFEFLILDEPTNHLDIQSKEILKAALKNYQGTFIVVSHDREFLENLTNRIWDIENQSLKVHHFGVKDFLKRKMALIQPIKDIKKSKPLNVDTSKVVSDSTLSYNEKKELKRQKNKWRNQISSSEKNIERLERNILAMDKKMETLDYSDTHKSNKILADYEILKKELDEQMSIWESATLELDEN